MTPALMHRIAWALQHGKPTDDERAAIARAAQQSTDGATSLPGAAGRLLDELLARARG